MAYPNSMVDAIFGKKQTFMERFSKAYEYPYGTSYMSSYTYEPGREMVENNAFERIIQGQKSMRPFHLQCGLTNKRICFCNQNKPFESRMNPMHSRKYQEVAYETHLFYSGFPEETLDRARDKLNFEKTRMLAL